MSAENTQGANLEPLMLTHSERVVLRSILDDRKTRSDEIGRALRGPDLPSKDAIRRVGGLLGTLRRRGLISTISRSLRGNGDGWGVEWFTTPDGRLALANTEDVGGPDVVKVTAQGRRLGTTKRLAELAAEASRRGLNVGLLLPYQRRFLHESLAVDLAMRSRLTPWDADRLIDSALRAGVRVEDVQGSSPERIWAMACLRSEVEVDVLTLREFDVATEAVRGKSAFAIFDDAWVPSVAPLSGSVQFASSPPTPAPNPFAVAVHEPSPLTGFCWRTVGAG